LGLLERKLHSSMRLEFEKLPLAEVAVRLTLAEPGVPMTLSFWTELWRSLGDRYERLEEAASTEVAPGTNGFVWPIGHLAGGHLFTRDRSHIVTLTPNLIRVNWIESLQTSYPRFEVLRDALVETYRRVSDTLGSSPGVVVANMSYTSLFEMDYEARSIFEPGFLELHGAGSVVQLSATRTIAPGAEHRVTLDRVSMPGVSPPRMSLTTAGGKYLSSGDDPVEALETIHEALAVEFSKLLSDVQKKRWSYVGS
jgi:hypothetical protein